MELNRRCCWHIASCLYVSISDESCQEVIYQVSRSNSSTCGGTAMMRASSAVQPGMGLFFFCSRFGSGRCTNPASFHLKVGGNYVERSVKEHIFYPSEFRYYSLFIFRLSVCFDSFCTCFEFSSLSNFSVFLHTPVFHYLSLSLSIYSIGLCTQMRLFFIIVLLVFPILLRCL